MKRMSVLAAACLAFGFGHRSASAQEVGAAPEPTAASAQSESNTPAPVVSEPANEAAATPASFSRPAFAYYFDPATGAFVKPIFGISGGYHYERRTNDTEGSLSPISTTPVLAIFGAEGRLNDWASFHSEFRRDPGFYGTSVWEGTASFTALDNYVKISHWGASLAAGIVSDPGTLDFYSAHVTDMFLVDRMTRTPLLHSGFFRGQGILAQYAYEKLTATFVFSSANPLSSTSSYGFGGVMSAYGGVYDFALSSITSGNPAAGVEFKIASSSLSYETKWVDAKVGAQHYWANINTNETVDKRLPGQLYRASLRGKISFLEKGMIVPFANYASRRNEMVRQESTGPNVAELDAHGYRMQVGTAGLDLNWLGVAGVGGSYAVVDRKSADKPKSRESYLNVGASYYITAETSAHVRYTKYVSQTRSRETGNFEADDGVRDQDSVYLILQLAI